VLTVLEENEASVWFVFVSEENFEYGLVVVFAVFITADRRACLSTESYAWVTTLKRFLAGLRTLFFIAWLMAELCALRMITLVVAGHSTSYTNFSTQLGAL